MDKICNATYVKYTPLKMSFCIIEGLFLNIIPELLLFFIEKRAIFIFNGSSFGE